MTYQPLMMVTTRTAVAKGKFPNLPVANARVAVYSDRIADVGASVEVITH